MEDEEALADVVMHQYQRIGQAVDALLLAYVPDTGIHLWRASSDAAMPPSSAVPPSEGATAREDAVCIRSLMDLVPGQRYVTENGTPVCRSSYSKVECGWPEDAATLITMPVMISINDEVGADTRDDDDDDNDDDADEVVQAIRQRARRRISEASQDQPRQQQQQQQQQQGKTQTMVDSGVGGLESPTLSALQGLACDAATAEDVVEQETGMLLSQGIPVMAMASGRGIVMFRLTDLEPGVEYVTFEHDVRVCRRDAVTSSVLVNGVALPSNPSQVAATPLRQSLHRMQQRTSTDDLRLSKRSLADAVARNTALATVMGAWSVHPGNVRQARSREFQQRLDRELSTWLVPYQGTMEQAIKHVAMRRVRSLESGAFLSSHPSATSLGPLQISPVSPSACGNGLPGSVTPADSGSGNSEPTTPRAPGKAWRRQPHSPQPVKPASGASLSAILPAVSGAAAAGAEAGAAGGLLRQTTQQMLEDATAEEPPPPPPPLASARAQASVLSSAASATKVPN